MSIVAYIFWTILVIEGGVVIALIVALIRMFNKELKADE